MADPTPHREPDTPAHTGSDHATPKHLPSEETKESEKGVATGILATLGCGAFGLLPFTIFAIAILFLVILWILRGV